MVIAANQPYFIPYLAYWQLIDAADCFLIGDDYAFIKQGWITRNRILLNGAPFVYRLEVKGKSSFRNINEIELLPIKVVPMLKTIEMAYKRAPFFQNGFTLIESILGFSELNLAAFLTNSILLVCDYLGINTQIGFTSSIPGNSSFQLEKRIFDFCTKLGADTYINAIGGKSLYSFQDFSEHEIQLRFLDSFHPTYKQFGNSFVGQLSILDAIMFNSREELHTMLKQYAFIDE